MNARMQQADAARVQPERGFIKAAGRELAVVRLRPDAPPSGPPLVFLHEGLGCIAMWKDVPAVLCHRLGREGILYDRWGHGRSEPLDRPRDTRYLHDEAESVLPAVLDALEVPRAALIGHSDGGSIALLFAAAAPERCAALVAEAAHVFVEDVTISGIQAAVEAYATTDLRQRLMRYHGDKTDTVFQAWHRIWLSPDFRPWNIERGLERVTCPALILQGLNDEYGTPAQVEAIARRLAGPVETALIPACGHVPHHQARSVVLPRIATFLERHASREPSP